MRSPDTKKHTTSNVQIITRLHQVSIFFALISPLIFMVTLNKILDFDKIILLSISAFILPLFISYIVIPPIQDWVKVEKDSLHFDRLGKVYFSEIREFNIDDYIKIKRKGHLTLLLQGNTKNIEYYKAFYTDFKSAIALWQTDQANSEIPFPGKKHLHVLNFDQLEVLAGYIPIVSSSGYATRHPLYLIGSITRCRNPRKSVSLAAIWACMSVTAQPNQV